MLPDNVSHREPKFDLTKLDHKSLQKVVDVETMFFLLFFEGHFLREMPASHAPVTAQAFNFRGWLPGRVSTIPAKGKPFGLRG